MYVSITPWWRLPRGADCGLFGPAYACARNAEVPAVLRDASWTEIGRFEQHLPVPSRFWVKPRRRWLANGICWFQADARKMIARAFALAALIGERGVPDRKAATRRPGTILYRDPGRSSRSRKGRRR